MEKQQAIISFSGEDLQNLVQKVSRDFFEVLPYIQTTFKHSAYFNNRLRTTAGRYFINQGNIELNPKYYEKYGLEGLISTIKHELAHYHLHHMGLPYKHRDKEFIALVKIVNAPMHAKPMRQYKYVYTCATCGVSFHRMKKINTNKYRCGKCRGTITLKETV